jgi:hypothetical protein
MKKTGGRKSRDRVPLDSDASYSETSLSKIVFFLNRMFSDVIVQVLLLVPHLTARRLSPPLAQTRFSKHFIQPR